MKVAIAAALAMLVLASCSDTPASPDATVDAAGDGSASPTAPSPPAIPWLDDGVPPIEIAPCPDGWREVAQDGVTTCDPYPEGGPADCTEGEAHFPGEASCSPIGSPCPTGDFSEVLPADVRIVHVQPGAMGGDGSATNPYGSVTEFSVAGLPRGSVIALSRGTHTGPFRVTRGVLLWGACAAHTTLSVATPSELEGVVNVLGSGGGVRDLSIADSGRWGMVLPGAGIEGTAAGVRIVRVGSGGAFLAEGARLTAETIVIRETQARTSDGRFGRGLAIQDGSTADLTRAILDQNRGAAVFAGDTGALTLADAVIRNTRSREVDGRGGYGFSLIEDASARAEQVLFEANHDQGIFANGPGVTLELASVVIRNTRGREVDGVQGAGLGIRSGTTADISRTVLEGNRDIGLVVGEAATALTLTDVVVRDTLGREPDGLQGRGLNIEGGATVSVSRAVFQRARELGIFTAGPGTTLTLVDVAVRETLGRDDGFRGRGTNVQTGSVVDATRALWQSNREISIFVSNAGSRATLADVVIRATQPEIRDDTGGRALNVQIGAMAEVTRALIEDNRDIGVLAVEAGTVATLTDVVVRNTVARACATTTCGEEPYGHDVGSYVNAALTMTSFVVERAEVCGVHVALDGQLDLTDGEVRDVPIGVCLQVEAYDLDRLTDSVRFVNNDVNLDATSLPIPMVADVAEAPDG